jgi:hypothetical protein
MASLVVLAMVLIPSVMANVSASSIVYGYVFVNGAGTNGITVNLTCNGSPAEYGTFSTLYDGNANPGYYQFDISNGSYYSVQASYNGYYGYANFTAGDSDVMANVSISVPTTTPTITPTATPTASPTYTPTATAAGTYTVTPVPTIAPTAEATYMENSGTGIWVFAAIAGILALIVAIIGAAYWLVFRKR